MNSAVDTTVFYVVCYMAISVGAVVAWRWGLHRSKGQVIALWIGVSLILPFRAIFILTPVAGAIQPIHVLMIAAAMAGTLGKRPSCVRIIALLIPLWGTGAAISWVFGGSFPEMLWDGPLGVLLFILDPTLFWGLFR